MNSKTIGVFKAPFYRTNSRYFYSLQQYSYNSFSKFEYLNKTRFYAHYYNRDAMNRV